MDFYLPVKSTIDKIVVDIARSLGIGFLELDDTVSTDNALSSPDDYVVYRFVGMDEEPRDPLWLVAFEVGAKTTTDPANYDLAQIMSAIKEVIATGKAFTVYDYSGVAQPTTPAGDLYIVDARVDPQMFDGVAGIRMLSVQARAANYAS